MFNITQEMAQQLVDLVSAQTEFNMIVCDASGIIIGDSRRERIGILHENAARIMRGEGESIAVTAEEEISSQRRMRQGFICLIKLDGERLGSVGIGGPVDIAKPIAKIAAAVMVARIRELQNMALIQEVVAKVSVNVEEAASAIEEISSGSRELISTGESVAQAVYEADGRVKDTNSIFALILEIADQTKLLGLNAAILAAQAGVHGKGFTVVADEIRKLAANSESSAKKIPQILSGIRNAMGKVESSSKQTYSVSRKQSESMHEIKRIMEDIQKSVNQLVDSVSR